MKPILLFTAMIAAAGFASTASAQAYCREYNQTVAIGGRAAPGYGTACLQPDGAWEVRDDGYNTGSIDRVNYYYQPPVYAAPPPVYYQPPVVVQPRPSLVFDFDFRDRGRHRYWDGHRHGGRSWRDDPWHGHRGHGRGHGHGHHGHHRHHHYD